MLSVRFFFLLVDIKISLIMKINIGLRSACVVVIGRKKKEKKGKETMEIILRIFLLLNFFFLCCDHYYHAVLAPIWNESKFIAFNFCKNIVEGRSWRAAKENHFPFFSFSLILFSSFLDSFFFFFSLPTESSEMAVLYNDPLFTCFSLTVR